MIALFFLIFQFCNNGDNAAITSTTAAQKDTREYTDMNKPGNEAISKFSKPQNAEKAERQKMTLMQIDASYNANYLQE